MNNELLKKKTVAVIIISILTMLFEVYFGIITNSIALTTDGIHMGAHVLVFGVTLIVCCIAINKPQISEKLDALGGYTSALLLAISAIAIIWESVEHLMEPVQISFNDALLIAVIGLVINLVCILIMGNDSFHMHSHGHLHECKCKDEHHDIVDVNLNYRAAYFHILADVMISVFTIVALLLGKYFGWYFADALIGIFGGIIIAKWALGVLKCSINILLSK